MMRCERACFFLAGAIVGIGVAAAVQKGLFRKACVGLVAKGMELKDSAAVAMERAKEGVEDVVAEAKYVNQQKSTEGNCGTV